MSALASEKGGTQLGGKVMDKKEKVLMENMTGSKWP